jgi:hypothetical protein
MFRFATAETTTVSSPKPRPGAPRDLVAVMLAAAEKLQANPKLKSARALLDRGGDELSALLDPERRPDWAFCAATTSSNAVSRPSNGCSPAACFTSVSTRWLRLAMPLSRPQAT